MLPEFFKIRAVNTQNQTITVTVKIKFWGIDPSTGLEFSSESTPISAAAITAGGNSLSSAIDNSSAQYMGAHLTLSVAAGSTTSGAGGVTLYLEPSTDAGSTYPVTVGDGLSIGTRTVTLAEGTSTYVKGFEI